MAFRYVALVRIATSKGGSTVQQKVYIDADSTNNAKMMLEAQYGRGCVEALQKA